MNRSSLGPADHVATVSVSFELAVDSPERPPHFHECHRNGEIKRVYESPAPEHCFHLQYQLLPPGGADDAAGRDGERKGGPIYSKSDVVTFGVVSKVYTEQVTRVVRCWNEKEDEKDEKEEEEEGEGEKEESEGKEKKTESRTHFGWRHKHTFPVSEELLLQLYDHTMEVRLWNSREKLAPRARFDRPRAFRLPIPPPASKEEDEKETSQSGRPDKFPLVRQQAGQTASTRGKRRARTRKKASNVSSISEEDTDPDLSASITEVPHSPTKEAVSLDENVEGTDQAPTTDQGEPKETTEDDDVPTDQSEPKATNEDNDIPRDQNQTEPPVTTAAGDGAPLKDHEMLGSVVLNHSSIFALHDSHVSKSKSRRMAAEAAEKARVEREGLVLLRLKMADLFAKRDSISAKMDTSTDNIRVFEVSVSLESPLMSDAHRRTLNPTVITVHRAINLPTQHLVQQQQRCDPVHISYQFHNLPPHHTPGHPHSRDITWEDSHVILLGTIDRDILSEYLRGPPLPMEVHDRDRCLDKVQLESLFGAEQRDELLGTHAFGAGGGVSEVVCQRRRPWDPFGAAPFDLSGLLTGQRVMKLTTPITAGPHAPPSREDCRVGPHGRELLPPLPAGDYLGNHSYLRITIDLSHPLPPPSLPPLPSLTPSPSTAQSSCPFARLVYLTSVDEAGLSLVARILDLVNDLNAAALGLDVLPRDMLPTALSTYKLTKWEMEGEDCDVVTGVQVRDRDVSLLVLEGPGHGAISRLWTRLPRHSSQDAGLVKTFYNSGCVFSRRLYGQLDVDLPLIFLPHSLSSLTQLSPLFIRGAVTPGALRALLCLSEMSACGGGMADLVRNSLFPSCEEMAALAAQFGVLPGGGELDLLDPGLSPRPEGEVSRSHTPVPPGNVTGEVRRRRRKRMKMPLLDMENRWYERMICERKDQETINHIDRNIALTHSLSEKAAQLPVHVRRRKTRMRSLTDSHTVHLYSSQTFNSAVLARARMRAELASDHTHQLYTYCQDYHSMTFEPFDPPNTQHTQRDIDRRKWRTREGFVYPGVSTARRSNTHPETPHPARAHDLNQPFKDGVLHANTDKPTVERLHFPWEQRGDDFSLHYHVPPEFGPRPPISIHLAGERRAAELQHFQKLDSHDWESKVVVKDTRFYTHRRGIRTELREKWGPRTRKFEDVLKDRPTKYSLRREGFRLEPVPPLDVVVWSRDGEVRGCGSEERVFQPGSGGRRRSLKVDGNVVPVRYQRTPSPGRREELRERHDRGFSPSPGRREELRERHDRDFRLFYHTHSPVSKRVILPLSPSEMRHPLFPSSTHPQDTLTTP